jgi:hypothetical protein
MVYQKFKFYLFNLDGSANVEKILPLMWESVHVPTKIRHNLEERQMEYENFIKRGEDLRCSNYPLSPNILCCI